MKMDDTFESEIIYDMFCAHLQIIKRYLAFIHVSVLNLFVLAPGESLQSKIMKPAPFMILMLILIIISITIQSNKWLRRYLCNLHAALSPGMTVGLGKHLTEKSMFSPIVDDYRVTQSIQEGLVGIYSMQGRRGNMEDRFSVMQDVQVGLDKKMSLIGVYDGHGGQFVAEYLRLHLFKNTVEKIKQLRTNIQLGNNGLLKSDGNKTTKQENGLKKRDSTAASPTPSRASSFDDAVDDKTKKNSVNESIKTEESSGSPLPKKKDVQEGDSEQPLKKDDAYNTLNIRKKSLANVLASKDSCAGGEEAKDDNQYIDVNKNINYTKLLTDQILNIDSQVIESCKSNSDLSGSTAVVALLDGELLVIGNVGDSRAVMADDRGRAVPLSFDHKPNQLKERRRIKEAGGYVCYTGVWRVAGILATSRALGDFPLKQPRPLITAEPDILTFSLADHKAEFVVLATDGLWDVVSNEEAVLFIRSRLHEPDFGAKSMAIRAYELGSQDNITVAVINFTKIAKCR